MTACRGARERLGALCPFHAAVSTRWAQQVRQSPAARRTSFERSAAPQLSPATAGRDGPRAHGGTTCARHHAAYRAGRSPELAWGRRTEPRALQFGSPSQTRIGLSPHEPVPAGLEPSGSRAKPKFELRSERAALQPGCGFGFVQAPRRSAIQASTPGLACTWRTLPSSTKISAGSGRALYSLAMLNP